MLRKDIITGAFIFILTAIVSTSGAYAFSKVIETTSVQVAQIPNTNNIFPVITGKIKEGSTTSTKAVIKPTVKKKTGMSLAKLANHNRAGNCYVSYKGTVYDVSAQISWSGCWHHGVTGGQDITAIFPHPTSYLAVLPVVGKLSKSAQSNVSNVTNVQRNFENEGFENEREGDD